MYLFNKDKCFELNHPDIMYFLLDYELQKHGINGNSSKSYELIAVHTLSFCNGINRAEIISLNFSDFH